MSQEEVKPPKTKPIQVKPQSARELQEENRVLVLKKQEERSRARKYSKDFVNKLIADDQKVIEEEKARESGRRLAQKELAGYYKSSIAQKETAKANSYRSRKEAGSGSHFFPYVEGEKIAEDRKVRNSQAREEMRGFLREQMETKPPRADRLFNGDPNYANQYVDLPSYRGREIAKVCSPGSQAASQGTAEIKQPVFLTRSREHMSRRLQDEHVRRALEDKVERTKAELEARLQRGQAEEMQFNQGMMVNDALRNDSKQSKLMECKQHSEYLIQQIDERRRKNEKELEERRSAMAGYFGPDEKGLVSAKTHIEHCASLIRQMEVDQHRKLASGLRRREQERSLADNALVEIQKDRERERQKLADHREVLVTTWDSQRKIREVLQRIEAFK
jgi:hypothetical protein